jgi:hypothetical protein
MARRSPLDVLPKRLAESLQADRHWFVIGGQAVRCFLPYRPSNDADFGVITAKDLSALVAELRRKGSVEVIERSEDTIHLRFEGIDVSVFVLPRLAPYVENGVLDVTGILATKVHALLDRGTRRDFFDLYVMLESERLGLLDCIVALESVYATEVNRGLILRALAYFDDAEAEARLPGEGPSDWATVKEFFATAVATLVVPPSRVLGIQSRVVDVRTPNSATAPRPPGARRAKKSPAKRKPTRPR